MSECTTKTSDIGRIGILTFACSVPGSPSSISISRCTYTPGERLRTVSVAYENHGVDGRVSAPRRWISSLLPQPVQEPSGPVSGSGHCFNQEGSRLEGV